MRALSAVGNAAFLGVVGAGAFFGYYTVRYNAEELQTVVQETHKEKNQFVGSTVRCHHHSLHQLVHGHSCSTSNSSFPVGLGSCYGMVP